MLELCSEDDYALWELFWAVAPFFERKNQETKAETMFIQLTQDLINDRLIVSKLKSRATGRLEIVIFDKNALALQLNKLAKPDPESFYWFGLSQ